MEKPGGGARSSAEEDGEGEAAKSSASDVAPLASEAAKEDVKSMSGSEETSAKEERVEVVEVVEVVRSRRESVGEPGSRSQSECVGSMLA